MSTSLMVSVGKSRLALSCPQKMVLMCLACHSNDKRSGACYPAIHSICEFCCLSKSAVIAALKKLEELKIIYIEKRKTKTGKDKSNNYLINIDMVENPPPHLAKYTQMLIDIHIK